MAKNKLAEVPQWQYEWLPDSVTESKAEFCHAIRKIIRQLERPGLCGLSPIRIVEKDTLEQRDAKFLKRMKTDWNWLYSRLEELGQDQYIPKDVQPGIIATDSITESIIRRDVLKGLAYLESDLYNAAKRDEFPAGWEFGIDSEGRQYLPPAPVRTREELTQHIAGFLTLLEDTEPRERLFDEAKLYLRNVRAADRKFKLNCKVDIDPANVFQAEDQLRESLESRPSKPNVTLGTHPQIILSDHPAIALTFEQAEYVKTLIEYEDWMSSSEFKPGSRPDRIRKDLPEAVSKHIVTDRKKGSRWV